MQDDHKVRRERAEQVEAKTLADIQLLALQIKEAKARGLDAFDADRLLRKRSKP
jgi:hypothetical protein